ncbi:MAG: 16S rRNA (cytosine(1402)-N(4))-methyltransferase RsmH [Patescibacteria group bacterium]|nr:16S rRNA (cytosine(1402)-N(4))-methyltransferase RsmH [Patescibacteria group bacterium]
MHKSVLQKEVIEYLSPKSNENFIDATLGLAGHTKLILEKIKPKGKILGIETDNKLYKELLGLNIDRLILVNDSFVNLKKIVEESEFRPISGILFDLGLSSWHLEKSKKGFSFLRNEPLDMRYNTDFTELTAEEILNQWPEKEIEKVLKEYGEERFARKIAREIIKNRKQNPIKTTFHLIEIIKKSVPVWYQHKKIHFATRTFQALRITVNDELGSLERVLPQSLEVLEKGGRIVVISFHSLEDRIVKNYFREQKKKGCLEVLTKKPIGPKREEIALNPRSRSSKLRAAVKI